MTPTQTTADKLEGLLPAGGPDTPHGHIIAEAVGELRVLAECIEVLKDRARQIERELADEVQISLAAANARVHRMGDNKPWKLLALVLVVVIVIGWVL